MVEGAAAAGRLADRERHRIERLKVIQLGQVLAPRQVGGWKRRRQGTGNGQSDPRCPQKRLRQFNLDSIMQTSVRFRRKES